MHDICVIQIRWNSVCGHLKLLVIKWLGLPILVPSMFDAFQETEIRLAVN